MPGRQVLNVLAVVYVLPPRVDVVLSAHTVHLSEGSLPHSLLHFVSLVYSSIGDLPADAAEAAVFRAEASRPEGSIR